MPVWVSCRAIDVEMLHTHTRKWFPRKGLIWLPSDRFTHGSLLSPVVAWDFHREWDSHQEWGTGGTGHGGQAQERLGVHSQRLERGLRSRWDVEAA